MKEEYLFYAHLSSDNRQYKQPAVTLIQLGLNGLVSIDLFDESTG